MSRKQKNEGATDDLAARAGWMYYLAGMTQSEIATELDVSRQRAQRLVARAVADGLVHVRLDHPTSACLEMERELKARYGLHFVRIAPSLPDGFDSLQSVAAVAAGEIERMLLRDPQLVVSVGTGRTLRAVTEEMVELECPGHKLVSLIGNANIDGSASIYEVILRMADKIGARHYPMALPVLSKDPDEREFYRGLPHVSQVFELARTCDLTIVGIGEVGRAAPLVVDGFIKEAEMVDLVDKGAIGELVGWVFDSDGVYLEQGTNQRINGVCVTPSDNPVVCIGCGEKKHAAIEAAIKGRLINTLITDEACAAFLLRD